MSLFKKLVAEPAANATQTNEEKPTFTPSYPGEKGVALDPDTVARLEAERHALLQSLHVEPVQSWQKPAVPAPVEEVIR